MIRLIRTLWRDTIMVCRASGNYGTSIKVGHGMTQGSPLSAKLFNILVNAVARKWFRPLRGADGYNDDEVEDLMATFFATFMLTMHTLP
jgi:hypothetical protein